MDSRPTFVVDRMLDGKAWPALATWSARPYTASWRQFGQHWPHTVPVELFEHLANHSVEHDFRSFSDSLGSRAFYAIGLGFFDFTIDYIKLLPGQILQRLRQREIQLLFYYHEGDNPYHIKKRLDQLCEDHSLHTDCYRFISGNTSANDIPGFVWFPDHELLYWHRNRAVAPTEIVSGPRAHAFTALNRTHKWWRATIMTDLWNRGLLDRAQWSYRTDVDCGDRIEDNPVEIDTLDVRGSLQRFLAGCPYTCDTATVDQQNDHHVIEKDHYTQSHFSLVIETHFDADGSGGAFLTEKTFKAIKHGHPFLIAGCRGSLAALRELGYRTFDHAIDNSYDDEPNNTQRWLRLRTSLQDLLAGDLVAWSESVRSDVEHNQRLFLRSKSPRLNTLLQTLYHD